MPVPTDFEKLLKRADNLWDSMTSSGTQAKDFKPFSKSAFDSKPNLTQITDFAGPASRDKKVKDSTFFNETYSIDAKPASSKSILWDSQLDRTRPLDTSNIGFSGKLKSAIDSLSLSDHRSVISGKMTSYPERQTNYKAFDEVDDSELENFLRNERENVLLSLLEETFKDTANRVEARALEVLRNDWEREKKKLVPIIPSLKLPESKPGVYVPTAGLTSRSTLSDLEDLCAQSVSQYVEKITVGGIPVKLSDLIQKSVQSLKNEKFVDIWHQVRIMIEFSAPLGSTADETRRSTRFKIYSTEQALKYLERQYSRHMQMIVYGNLEQGQLGGVPGVLNLVKAYLNVKMPNGYPTCEEGFVQGHPIWALIYYCLRVGDIQAAYNICAGNESEIVLEFGNALKELHQTKASRLSPEMESKCALLWRTVGRPSQDPFKRAAFCVISLCDVTQDHSEIAEKFEDWLWIKLRQVLLTENQYLSDEVVYLDSTISTPSGSYKDNRLLQNSRLAGSSTFGSKNKLPLDKLKTQILVEYGEAHFAAAQSPTLYFSALWLTGQFETALEFLHRQHHVNRDYHCHALHIALVLLESDLLLTPLDAYAKLLSLNPGETHTNYRLNLARMIMTYVSTFKAGDLRDALNYLYFLKYFKTSDDENLFYSAIRDILLDTKEYELLLGRLDKRGTRLPGLIDDTKFKVKSDELIAFVALDAEKRGLIDTAVTLLDLCGDHSQVLRILNESICQVASQASVAESKREKYTKLATKIAKRYQEVGYRADESLAATFFQLLDIVTFFDLFYSNNYINAIEVLRRIEIIPLNLQDVDQYVKLFYMVSDEVRRILPSIILSAMTILSQQFIEKRDVNTSLVANSDGTVKSLQESAKALVQYAAMIPYRMPGDTAARLVQMETFMH